MKSDTSKYIMYLPKLQVPNLQLHRGEEITMEK